MEALEVCPHCDTDLEFHDDSFDHAFGVEVIRFYSCPKCNADFDETGEELAW